MICQTCGHEVRRESPQSAAEMLAQLPEGTRFLVTFEHPAPTPAAIAELQADGFVRAVIGNQLVNLVDHSETAIGGLYVIIDRLTAGAALQRVREALEGAFAERQRPRDRVRRSCRNNRNCPAPPAARRTNSTAAPGTAWRSAIR